MTKRSEPGGNDMEDNDLDGARVLVVGASSGLGLAAASAFAARGSLVTMAARSPDKLSRAVAEVGGRATALVLDTLDSASVQAAFAGEPFHHVVVTASQTRTGSVRDMTLDDAHAAMESKFWGAYRVARASRIVPGGSLTFVSGMLAVRPSPSSVLQGAINAGLEGLARGLALELAPVRVNTVSPGLVDTPLFANMEPGKRDAMFASARKRLPVGRVGAAGDVAQAIVFLAGNPYATGSTVSVDGGASIA